jgi:bacteriocin-like protein
MDSSGTKLALDPYEIVPLSEEELQTIQGGGIITASTLFFLLKVVPWTVKIGPSGFVKLYTAGSWVWRRIRG